MSQQIELASRWIYQGLWGVLTRWFRVPPEPPVLPALAGESIQSFRPAQGFLRYLKFQFWLSLVVLNSIFVSIWFALVVALPWLGLLVMPLVLVLVVAPAIIGYLAIYLRFDTTWYVISDRSMRLRRGIWVIRETTITFENVQNVEVNQGPLQRLFAIADVTVKTAGGGGGGAHGAEGAGAMAAHHGRIEGVSNARDIRDLIMSRLKTSRVAGLGDEAHLPAKKGAGWTPAQRQTLSEIRDVACELARRRRR